MNSGLAGDKTAMTNYSESTKRLTFERESYNLAKDKNIIGSISNLVI